MILALVGGRMVEYTKISLELWNEIFSNMIGSNKNLLPSTSYILNHKWVSTYGYFDNDVFLLFCQNEISDYMLLLFSLVPLQNQKIEI